MQQATRAYLWRFSAVLLAYAATLAVSIVIIRANESTPWRFIVAVLPMVPAALLVPVVLRYVQTTDELEQRMQLHALAFAYTGTALVTFTYGFVENVGAPHLNWFFVWPVMAVLWIVGGALARRRYR